MVVATACRKSELMLGSFLPGACPGPDRVGHRYEIGDLIKNPLGKPLTSIISEKWELRNCTLVQESLFFRSGSYSSGFRRPGFSA